jgi:ribosomal protein S14
MKYLNNKNKKNRKLVKSLEKKIFILKTIQYNTNLFYLIRWKANKILTSISKNSFKTSITNRCIISNRKKRLNKIINLSRLVFLDFARSGEIHGIRKAVW